MSIDQCPEEINQHEALGHWEIDTVPLTLTERQTRFEIIRLIPDKTSASVNRALLALQEKIQFKSLTSDNGRKFARLHEAVTCPTYYYHAYASFERGSNENHNRMIRRFLPKGTKQTTALTVSKIET
ncbi:IS30 family transposase [Lactovum miscens]|uniref:IS30 family transposase n=1 Tax=Lactovum miscens TaxID=190387 RepID=A0A841C7C2_9LACT|nr:IS30 family transposase [Lactovum miscens]MBB5888693.1 IS30 family transposase [Lactovum miscens]